MRPQTRGWCSGTLLAVVVPCVTAAAQTETRSWQTCTVGAVHACNTIVISTTAIFQSFARVGTNVFLELQNQQGTNPLDNTGGSSLRFLGFMYPPDGGQTVCPPTFEPCAPNPDVTGVALGQGASGSGSWEIESQMVSLFGDGLPNVVTGGYVSSIFTSPIDGCADASSIIPSNDRSLLGGPEHRFTTCGPKARIAFDMSVPTWIDAGLFNSGVIITTDIHGNDLACNLFSGDNGCAVERPVTTPEPGTLLLLGSGLCAVTGLARRRRRA